jgi:hypothetical protein
MLRIGRRILARIALITIVPASIFGVAIIVTASDEFGLGFFENISRFLKDDPLGIAIFVILGILTLVFFLSLVLRLWEGERLRRLHYSLLSYLVANTRLSGRRTPLEQIAGSISADPYDVEMALNVLIARGEVRGRIDLPRGLYIHSNVTKKGHLMARMSAPFEGKDGPSARGRRGMEKKKS